MSALPEFLRPPPQASEVASRVDDVFLFTLVVAGFFSALIAALLFYFGWRYRRRDGDAAGTKQAPAPVTLEIAWSVIPLGILLFMFYWGARVFLEMSRPPPDADEYFVVARQWMWKVQHPDGPREIDQLHVPVGRAIKLTMTSEDVIHSFFVPAFRIKQDVIPGRTTTAWFRADRPGTYHLFCAEYCGTEHSKMVGQVIVMEQARYEEWLSGGGSTMRVGDTGEGLFNARGCATCHVSGSAARAPILTGIAGRTVTLRGGEEVVADDAYLRESILRPAAKIVSGYAPVMPSYEGQLSEEELLKLVGYVRSLGAEGGER